MKLVRAFHAQAAACATLGSPFMARLMTLLADRLEPDHGAVARRLFEWPGDVTPAGASLPLRLAGGLHALRLGGDAGLAAVYPPANALDDALWDAVSAAMTREAPFLLDWVRRAPQTNEIRRAAVFRAAGHWLTARYGLPLELAELGASAGLNLHWDAYALLVGDTTFGPKDSVLTLAPDWTGVMPPANAPRIAARRGNDLAPLSPIGDRMRLLAYLWPDQPGRLAMTEAALALPPAPVDAADAADWLDALSPQLPGTCRMICHSVAWQYFPDDVQARARATIADLGAATTTDRPLAHLEMETDGATPGARLTLTTWPGGTVHDAGRADFHGRWIDWRLT
ncbi:DUF2332 family protein [uncultured Jannaschia sp.]|uniref:DUF2332 domain-containing protein n=1 Tax=uncultured Jannaschia sp. TaxID=293347 RepID=UPI002602602B|nr:DUF2332 family protein [uncultured Jannaschia sp.]